ncbi:methylaspartate mutase accessory protein GlmL [Nocardioides nanhaiensis]|uniref:Methylaspartate mutase accessory protein GlmL n=1 Tax=Nocardioides nanhaiensis TaxID=1476871 RepID=A0ABP8W0X1_9ACTN
MPSAEAGTDGVAGATVICLDVGSTFTKALLVGLCGAEEGQVLATAEHRTTVEGDVMDGVDACLAQLAAADPRARDAEVLACSSAGGGLRIAVLGNEEFVTAEAGRRVALSSGGTVVAVVAAAGRSATDLERHLRDAVAEARPDVVLLTGGTDGGNAEVLLTATAALVAAGWRGPVVAAGNVDAAEQVGDLLAAGGVPHVLAPNVVPRIGVLAPEGARAAVREVFLAHVIGGKHLSARPDFAALVRGATPDVVLTGVELLAGRAGDVVVVDVGGATTDVHSVVEIDPEDATLARDVVAPTRVTRTVEGDLGMRWSAVSTLEAAGLDDDPVLLDAARQRRERPGLLPGDETDPEAAHAVEERLARAAVGLALRRHAGRSRVVVSPEGRVVERTGRDLREVALLVGSGGVLRHGRPGVRERVLRGALADDGGGWQLPEGGQVAVDDRYVLAAVGLLAGRHPGAATRLADSLLAQAPAALSVEA